MTDLDLLRRHLLGYGRTLLGYSGGVDSALLAVVGREVLGPERFLAVIGRSASYPEAQWRSAVELARRYEVPLLEVARRLADPPTSPIPPTLLFCKTGPASASWHGPRLRHHHRRHQRRRPGRAPPGLRAEEHGVRSPSTSWAGPRRRCATSRALGLPTWDAPAVPCLSSRVAYGPDHAGRLRPVEDGEAYLRALGVTGDLRVRHHGDRARIEAAPDQLARLRGEWDAVAGFFAGLGFAAVELDPAGYRRGGLLALGLHSPG
jgi:uncharacterized protein